MARGVSDFYKDDLIFGIIAIVFGILFMIFRNEFFYMLKLAIGVYIILGAVKNIYLAWKVRKYELNSWILMLIISAVMLVIGIFGIVKKGFFVNLYASMIISYAVLDIIDNVIFILRAKKIFE